ncbi:MAG TPA: hypothetical protein VIK53_13670 [Verrucomicrobiae bacterium]
MNKTLRFVLGLVGLAFVLFLIGGYVSYSHKVAESQSVVNVINQGANAARHSTQIRYLVTGKSLTNFLASQYIGELQKIDTSACPKKFQLAWLNYVQAWEAQAQQTPGRRFAEAYLEAVGVMTHSSSLEKVGTRGIEVADATTRAWQNVEMVALEYDVRMKYQ